MKSKKLQTEDAVRLEHLKDYYGITYRQMAKDMGRSEQSFYDIKCGKTKISQKFATDICDFYKEISLGWLLTGEGEMLRHGPTATSSDHSTAIAGNNNTITPSAHDQSTQALIDQLATKDKQINRLLSLLEAATGLSSQKE